MSRWTASTTDSDGNRRVITSDDRDAIRATADYWRTRDWASDVTTNTEPTPHPGGNP